jgi:hypothetical protein
VREDEKVMRAVYAKAAAARATTRPPKEMALPAAAPTDWTGTEALEVALPAGVVDEAPTPAELEAATAPVLAGTVELTPGTMGTIRDERGATGVAVARAGVETVVLLVYVY